MQIVQRTVIRAISVLNVFFMVAGFYFIGTSIIHRMGSEISNKNGSYFWLRIIISSIFLVLLAISAKYLWHLRTFGLRFSNILFALEVAYVFGAAPVEAWLTRSGALNASNLASTSGDGDIGLAPQMLTLFPFIALLLLNVFWPASNSRDAETQTIRVGDVRERHAG